MKKISIAILITCFNRSEITLECLKNLFSQQAIENITLDVFLVDDNSPDKTGKNVKLAFPQVNVIEGTGSLYWCNGTRLAWEHAKKYDPDFFMLLNDDTNLNNDCLKEILKIALDKNYKKPSIIVGVCQDPVTLKYSYGGKKRQGFHPLGFTNIIPNGEVQSCDSFNGNIVLIPRKIFLKIGMLRKFKHSMGDIDYGLRAVNAGFNILCTPNFVGQCKVNRVVQINKETSLLDKMLILKKQLPILDFFRILWYHSSFLALILWPIPYIKIVLGIYKK